MAVLVPVIEGIIQDLSQLIQGLETPSFQRQRAKLLPPRLNQVQPTGIFGDELQLHFRPGSQSEFGLLADMDRQVILNDQPMLGGKSRHNLLQQLHMTGAVSSRAEHGNRFSGRRLKGTMHPQLPASAIVRFKRGPVRTFLPLFSGIGFDGNRPHFIHADHPRAGERGLVGRNDAPLFSTNSGSAFSASWNQLSWRFQRKPSPSTHSQMVESDKCTPSRSWNAVWMRSSVQSLKGYPRLSGFVRARAIKALRTVWEWVSGRPAFGLSSKPAMPASLNRLTQSTPDWRPLKPACCPAWVACSFGSSNIATITFARWTCRWAAFRDAANLRISVSSSVVNVRSFTAFRMASSCLGGL